MNKEILLVKKRKDGFVAPFINGWNVWEIEEKYWVDSVKNSILHAYELGKIHCLSEMEEKFNEIDANFIRLHLWPEPEKE